MFGRKKRQWEHEEMMATLEEIRLLLVEIRESMDKTTVEPEEAHDGEKEENGAKLSKEIVNEWLYGEEEGNGGNT